MTLLYRIQTARDTGHRLSSCRVHSMHHKRQQEW
jgi:hypothetical protein